MFTIPFLRPPFGVAERAAAYRIMSGANVSTGAEIQEFEEKFRQYIGADSCYTVCNGSIALDLIWQTYLRTGRLKKGDRVLLPSFTFVSVANSIVNAGLVPVFDDIRENTWNMEFWWDENTNYLNYHDNIKAICLVHTFGTPCDLNNIEGLKENYLIVEDCAEACGASYHSKKCGSFGHAAAFSFNATKNMTCGEGGAVVFNDKESCREEGIAMLLKENGFGYQSRNAILPGYNFRLDNIHCAILLKQLETLDQRNLKRMENKLKIFEALADEGLFLEHQKMDKDNFEANQILGFLFDNRDKVYEHLIKNGVEAKRYFYPAIHNQTYYSQHYIFPDLPNTEEVSSKIICLPFDDKIDDESIGVMVQKIKEVI